MISPSSPPPRKGPNPFVLLSLFCLSSAAFYLTIQYRAATYPASKQPRQFDNPLIPPARKEDNPPKP